MSGHYPVTLAGETLWLLADKAVYWPRQAILMIADAHFGKAAAYRKLGQPVPRGTTASNLQNLDRLLHAYPVEHLIFLGDFFHAPESLSVGTLAALNAWREATGTLQVTLIRGNHDRRAGDPPAYLRMAVVNEPLRVGPFALAHEPDVRPGSHVLAGHVHPAYRLRGLGRQRLRLPCFHLGAQVSLLPAFGAFTGGFNVEAGPGERIYVVGDGQVWPVNQATGVGGGSSGMVGLPGSSG